MGLIIFLVILGIIILAASVRVVTEYERGVIFRLGRLVGAKGPGLFFLIPIVDKMVKVSLRTINFDVQPQEVMTKDNVPVKVNAVIYFRVIDPCKSVTEIENFRFATMQIAQTTLRGVVGEVELDELLSNREKLNERLQSIIDQQTDPWGIKVSVVEMKEIEIPDSMKRAMARQAEVERERRAKIINAQGEYQAAEKLSQAAKIISEHPEALQLRYLQTLGEITTEHTNTIIFPLPINLLESFGKLANRTDKSD
ncbi:slipin family protein [Candidatus Aerophobetes bacterium]|uniref:Slipin family protein n=1 Tax=Aerophobetes bacterium TaxID=2030807 RepID=A0A497E332_UNCAE|nr:slipin family protein [Candidatus Aerophobetes bacterium]RLE08258.1 MAG: slipin family protein [Candidatus Aerophobetes bacterium]